MASVITRGAIYTLTPDRPTVNIGFRSYIFLFYATIPNIGGCSSVLSSRPLRSAGRVGVCCLLHFLSLLTPRRFFSDQTASLRSITVSPRHLTFGILSLDQILTRMLDVKSP